MQLPVGAGSEDYLRPTPFELALSWTYGIEPDLDWDSAAPSTPRAALESVLLPALASGPCYVTFSGGRDSSAILAAATVTARRHGLADPVPVSLRYPADPQTDESSYQDLVVAHLQLREWIRFEITDENDLLGSTARASILRRGLLVPAALHVQDTVFGRLDPGCVLTGEGGDEVLGVRRITPVVRLAGGVVPRDLAGLRIAAEALAPKAVRRQRLAGRLRKNPPFPWLRPAAMDEHIHRYVEDTVSEPLPWGRSVRWVRRRRMAHVISHNKALIGHDHGHTSLDPLLEPSFLSAVAAWGGWRGPLTRTHAMAALFGDILPPELINRRRKAHFGRSYFGPHTKEFAQDWDGSGVDHEIVDPDELRRLWLTDTPPGPTGAMLHAAWLNTQNRTVE